ncbi:hypothetical protein FJM67_15660 [Maribrevibacterium harenarium]|uniref:Uncharacterized protein n=1 Tax=Maribrevibacterium harenarium TaxID=2589817 RepID=A0A501W9U9_9GAMM|nr:hypothetical protein [Maribrevibacterium harenarium]TPE46723.1 hypothetical protein FJM67_15660 [Maribrevibacterium harenarium]
MITYKYLFEIPVYRLSENNYYEQMRDHISQTNRNKEYPIDEGYLRKEYGGNWRYNEIIGFLRFFRYGQNQIRCEYWETDAKKKVRTRKKQYSQVSDSYCTERFSLNYSNEELANTMKSAVEHCEQRLKRRVLDCELFDATVDLIDWKALLS